jgi:hypothetical protein
MIVICVLRNAPTSGSLQNFEVFTDVPIATAEVLTGEAIRGENLLAMERKV